MSALTNLRQKAADLLNESGIPAVAAFEPESRKLRTEPVAAVSLAQVACQSGGFQNYLGRYEEGQDSGELYGRAVELTLALDIYGPRDSGGMEFLDSCGLYHLPVRCLCRAWLAAVVREDGEFVDIRVKGRTV